MQPFSAHYADVPSMNEQVPLLTTLNFLQTLFCLWFSWGSGRLRYKLRLGDLAEMFLQRGFTFTYEAVRDWEARFAPLPRISCEPARHGQAGKC